MDNIGKVWPLAAVFTLCLFIISIMTNQIWGSALYKFALAVTLFLFTVHIYIRRNDRSGSFLLVITGVIIIILIVEGITDLQVVMRF